MQTGKALVQVQFPVHALSENTKSIMKKKSEKKNAKFKMLSFCRKIIFSVSNIFMQMFKVSTLCMQSIRCQQQKLCCKLNSPCMHYLRTQNPYEEEKWLSSKGCHFCPKLFFSWYQISSCKCTMFLHHIYKVLECS